MIKIDKIKILLIEDEDFDVRRIRRTVKPVDGQLIIKDVVSDGYSALDLIKKGNEYDVVIMDFQISGGLKGERLIKKCTMASASRTSSGAFSGACPNRSGIEAPGRMAWGSRIQRCSQVGFIRCAAAPRSGASRVSTGTWSMAGWHCLLL